MPRLRQVMRTVLVSSLALVLWTFARPAAAASAPFCDDRGASAIAPPPALEAADVAIQRVRAAATCPGEDSFLGVTLTRGRAPVGPAAVQTEPVIPVTSIVLPPLPSSDLAPTPHAERPDDGVRSRVERPPRG